MNSNNRKKVVLFWFRRDLRIVDNHALYLALKGPYPVLPLFIFDNVILNKLEEKSDPRITFIHQEITRLDQELKEFGSSLIVRVGEPVAVWKQLISDFDIAQVYANHDYEPYAIKRDNQLQQLLKENGISLITAKDQVIFEKEEVVKADGKPYTVYTPYSKLWKSKFKEDLLGPFPSASIQNWLPITTQQIPDLSDLGFIKSSLTFPDRIFNSEIIKHYHQTRDIPGISGTSRIGLHLRFGTISIRSLVSHASQLNEKYLNELIWREFYATILWHFPDSVENNFYKKYDRLKWINDDEHFSVWCEGKTGYPIVDAGMRELNATGYMHNRVRMIVASFLTKHLLIDWRWGEAYFARKLLDYEQASNVGGWQWAAGTGVDAAPYFRVFNPEIQMKKFDPNLEYIKKWVPELSSSDYPQPIIDHKFARERAIKTYQEALRN